MKARVTLIVQPGVEADWRTDRIFRKEFDVDWPGRPLPGERIEVDLGPPIEDLEFTVDEVYWSTSDPVTVILEPVVVSPEEVEWEDGLDGYVRHARRRGWEVTGR